jgi:NAD(P)-dependent dehydrogenase (short-subunit alcohol dehydrogenase family)
MTDRILGHVILITGGTSGIGLDCARAVGREGATVVVTGRNVDNGRKAEAVLTGEGIDAAYLPADATQHTDWTRVMAQIDSRWGRLDALVNNAGTCTLKSFQTLSVSEARTMLATNFLAGALGLHHAIPRLRAAGGGSVVSISSVAALRPAAGNGAYAGSKAALRGLHEALAPRLASGPTPVRLHVVFPGLIWGEGVIENFGEERAGAFRETIVASTPLNRVGRPQDISQWVAWLVNPASRSVWGSELVVDGGLAFGTLSP